MLLPSSFVLATRFHKFVLRADPVPHSFKDFLVRYCFWFLTIGFPAYFPRVDSRSQSLHMLSLLE